MWGELALLAATWTFTKDSELNASNNTVSEHGRGTVKCVLAQHDTFGASLVDRTDTFLHV
jgi:hypothetical protein